jgi:hypothetical protein
MQLTILASKLPNQSLPQFIHEFRIVHATETRNMAHSLGIIFQYIQGIALHSTPGQDSIPVKNQPLAPPREPIESFAQLTWPGGLEVMQGSFTTQGYKDSAGKHIFAVPRKIYLTDRLEPDSVAREGILQSKDAVRLIVGLVPHDPTEISNFRKSWDKHASLCRAICTADNQHYYQRNQILPLDAEHIETIFADTHFPANAVVRCGGYEEFVFQSGEAARAFCERYGEELRSSYEAFTTGESYFAGFDVVVQYDEKDRGYRQIVAGAVVGMILRAKVYFGL